MAALCSAFPASRSASAAGRFVVRRRAADAGIARALMAAPDAAARRAIARAPAIIDELFATLARNCVTKASPSLLLIRSAALALQVAAGLRLGIRRIVADAAVLTILPWKPLLGGLEATGVSPRAASTCGACGQAGPQSRASAICGVAPWAALQPHATMAARQQDRPMTS